MTVNDEHNKDSRSASNKKSFYQTLKRYPTSSWAQLFAWKCIFYDGKKRLPLIEGSNEKKMKLHGLSPSPTCFVQGPAPLNLHVPAYSFKDNTIVIGSS